MATHSSTFAWKIPWTEEPGGLQSMDRKESDTTERLHLWEYQTTLPASWVTCMQVKKQQLELDME